MRFANRLMLRHFVSMLLLLVVLAGCSDSDKKTTGDTVVNMNDVTMVIPQGAVDSDLSVSPIMTLDATLPAAVPTGATVASKTMIISGVTYNFIEPVQLTMPYDPASLGTDDIPGVFFYDEGSGTYSMVGIKNIDTTAKTVTFTTTHGGKYVAMGIAGLAADLGIVTATPKIAGKSLAAPVVDSGFTPGTDGFFHPNFGAYDSPGGSCLGMANFSVWYYAVTKATNSNTGLYSMYREGDTTRWQDDLTARELISRAFMSSSQAWAKSWMQKEYKLGPEWTGYFIVLGLKLSGPMTFLMADQWPGMQSGHATVVYKYDAGKFYIYDVNFPNEVVTINWGKNSTTQKFEFTNYSKNAAYNPQFTQFSFEGFATFAESNQYKQLFEGAQGGWSADSKFNTLAIASATDSKNQALTVASDGSIEMTEQDTIKINGTATGGIKTAKYIIYRLNGGQRYRVSVTGGAFTITPPAITLGTNTLMMVATDDPHDEWNAYGGFKEISIKIKGKLFFENAGFESATAFDKWIVETHTWQNATPGSVTPGKSAIVTAGIDPIATTINMVYAGNQSARINNYDSSYHISSASQTATVPNAANPQAKFYWAAVLEDPQHEPANQPYIDVLVTDDTAGKTLYYKNFYTNDPSYSGWLVFGDWKAINWQTITLGFTQADAGHKITVKVTAADCGYGGHGGYVYLDGDE